MKKKNQHELPHGLHEEEDIYGDIIIFSNDLDAEPVDLHLKDWTEFLKVARLPHSPTLLPSLSAPFAPFFNDLALLFVPSFHH